MKKTSALFTLVLLVAASFFGCEKDDICAEGTLTTPSILIEFYDRDNTTVPKAATNFGYFVEGMDTIKITGNATEIRLPLRVDTTSVKWGLILSTPVTGQDPILNTDFLEFDYTTQQLYVSRACGYKTNFFLTQGTDSAPNPLLTDSPDESELWIQEITVDKTNIEDENEAHIRIFF